MNKPLLIWGIALLIGFSLTQYLIAFSSFSSSLIIGILWIILIIISALSSWISMEKQKKKEGSGLNSFWMLSIILGAILTVLFILDGAYYYIIISWFFMLGTAGLATGIKGSPRLLHMSMIWIFIGLFLLLVTIRLEFLFGIIGFAIPMIYYGIRW